MKRATAVAILNANYMSPSRLKGAYDIPVVYTGRGGRVAHECIIDHAGPSKSRLRR